MKSIKWILPFLIFYSCTEIQYNETQFNKTLELLPCLKEINANLIESKQLWNSSDQKLHLKAGSKTPVTVTDKYRLIEQFELEEKKELNFMYPECSKHSELKNYFNGIRIPSKSEIIIEVNKFERSNYQTQYSRNKLIEIHRIVFYNEEIQSNQFKNFMYPVEKIIYSEQIEENILYIISQY